MIENGHTTKNALLDAAETLFAARGYEGASVREIVERAGANIAAIKYHFGSKSDLYVATVSRAMERSGSDDAWRILEDASREPLGASIALVRFIEKFLCEVCATEAPNVACNLMIREASHPGEAIEAIVAHFIRPHHEMLVAVIGGINPRLDSQQRSLHAVSVMGQIVHYRMFRPFLDRLNVVDLTDADAFQRVVRHLATVALAGIGCDAAFTRRAIDAASGMPRDMLETEPL